MEYHSGSYFKYPATIVIVDDDKTFLSELSSTLNQDRNELFKPFTHPEEALAFLKGQNFIFNNYQRFLETVSSLELDINDNEKVSKINFDNIFEMIYDDSRFNEISVIIVDYLMPGMNGLEFFKEIKNIPAKKILLTGIMDYQLAVNAFNEGIIDRFVIKGVNIRERISESIDELANNYFQEFSSVLLKGFDKGIKKADQYSSVFRSWYDMNNIIEYYQCEANGSCVGFDKNGEIYWLLISPDEEIKNYAETIDDSSKLPFIEPLLERTKLLYFQREKDRQLPLSEWEKHMFPVTNNFIVGGKKYLYSFITGSIPGINIKEVLTAGDLKNSLEQPCRK